MTTATTTVSRERAAKQGLVHLLSSFPAAAIEAASCEEMIEAVISAGDASSYLRMSHLVPTLRTLAINRLRSLSEKLQSEKTDQLERRVGHRNVRSFRIVRVRDALPSDHGSADAVSSKRDRCKRSVLVRIWDYAERTAAQGFALREGDHYMVSRDLAEPARYSPQCLHCLYCRSPI